MTSRLVIVGGGPHALAVLSALAERPEPWPASVVVVDPHPSWTSAWDDKLARLALDRLRSPQVHHPGPRPMQLRDLVEAQPVAERLALRRPEDERVPTPLGMRALVDVLIDQLGPVEWIVGDAASIDLADAAADGRATGDETAPAAIVGLQDGRRLDADIVVLANNPSAPRVPAWAQPLVEAGRARHASTVDLRTEPSAGRHVAIVGGGLTAACLALETVRGGGHATLLTRRALRARPYDVDASWLGPRRLNEFRAADLLQRRALIDVARDGGTMPQRVLDELLEAASDQDSGLVIREGVPVEAEVGALLSEVDDLWLATGFVNDVRTDPLVAPLLASRHIAVYDGLPEVTDDLRLPGTPVFVAGPYSALGVGPASRNLSGARPAAAAIARGIASVLNPV